MKRFLPKNSGPYSVGCTDIITKYGTDRSLFRMYYPVANEIEVSEKTAANWLPEAGYADGYSDFLKLKLFSGLFRWIFSSTKVFAVWNGQFHMPKNLEKLPVVIFSHGLGGNRTTYSAICSDFASQGVFVAAIEHADQSASATYYLDNSSAAGDAKVEETPAIEKKWINFLHVPKGSENEHKIRNQQVHTRSDECIELLNQIEQMNAGHLNTVQCDIDLSGFKDKLDLEKCAIIGHSFGGATSIASLSKDNRFKLGVGLDAWMFPLDDNIYKNLSPVPFLFINTEEFHWEANVADMRKLDSDTFSVNQERIMTTLCGTVHQSQSDFPLLVDNKIISKLFKMTGTANPFLAQEVSNKLTFGFIGKHLDLDFGKSVTDVIESHSDSVYVGSNIPLDEERIKSSKERLRSTL